MLCIRILTKDGSNEGSTSTRELNELFKTLLDEKMKEIKLGKYSQNISDIISITVFERKDK
jgi:hypothetical protein